jgi:hypothetical protein
MSILSVRDIQGIAAYNNTVRVPSGHIFDVQGNFKVPTFTTVTRPTTTTVGLVGFNTTTSTVQVYTGATNGWVDIGKTAIDGTTQASAVDKSTDILVANPAATTGWYWIKVSGTAQQFWVDCTYRGGGWILVLNNRSGNGGMNNLTYSNAVNNVINSRGNYGTGYNPSNFNLWVGLSAWKTLADANTGTNQIVEFVANGYQRLQDTPQHAKRAYWDWTGWSASYALTGYANKSIEVGGSGPGWYDYHIANNYSLTTYDNDQDAYGANCSQLYNNNPWWYGACWSGNGFAGGGYSDSWYWDSSGGDYWSYGCAYIK